MSNTITAYSKRPKRVMIEAGVYIIQIIDIFALAK